MKYNLSRQFIDKLKNVDVRIKKSVIGSLSIFLKNPNDPQLDNHPLKDSWSGFRSIDAVGYYKATYRLIYEEKTVDGITKAYFVTFGTHQELYT